MRTDNNPTSNTQSVNLTSKVQDYSLVNQLFNVGDGGQSFNQILSSQMQPKREPVASTADSGSAPRCQGAKHRPDSGNQLPDDRRLEKQQRAERDARETRAEDHQSDQYRADQQRDSKRDQEFAATEQAQGDAHCQDQLNEAQAQEQQRIEDAQASVEDSDESVDKAALSQAEQSLELANADLSSEDFVSDSESGEPLAESGSELAVEQGVDSGELDLEAAITSDRPESEQSGLTDSENLVEGNLDQSEAMAGEIDGKMPLQGENAELTESKDGTPKAVDPEVQVALSPNPAGLQKKSTKQAHADEPKSTRDASMPAASLQATKEQQVTAKSSSADGQGASGQSDTQEMPVFEPKGEKKVDLGVLADKLAQKPVSNDGVVATPVQERLAALAKALDKAGSSTSPQAASKSVEQADSAKATPFQRSLEQVSRIAGTGKPQMTTMQAPLQSREWAGEMTQRLVMMVSTKLNSAKIQLNPQEMGSIDVKVSVKHDQAHVVFTSQVAPTRDALEQAVPRLREMMEQNGVALGDVDVRDQDTRESYEQGGQDQRRGTRVSEAAGSADDAGEVSSAASQMAVGLVDYYA